MILYGNQRGGGAELARHLTNLRDNDHVEIHELRGFLAEDLTGAFKEIQAIAKGTRCRQYLYSLSLNPPADAEVPIEAFEKAADQAEQALGLSGQPRALVFHEKDGRRHAHAVWSRIDVDQMRAINIAFPKLKLREVSKALYHEYGWRMPRGLMDVEQRNPFNYTREEWQQAQRAKKDPQQIKQVFRDCWAVSDTGAAFASALQEHGYTLARGDRRGFVAVDYQGEVYAIARYSGVRTKQVREKFGDLSQLPSVDEAKADIARRLTPQIRRYIPETEAEYQAEKAKLDRRRAELRERQRAERAELKRAQQERWDREHRARQARLSRGLLGVWHWLTGRQARIQRKNAHELLEGDLRDRTEHQTVFARGHVP